MLVVREVKAACDGVQVEDLTLEHRVNLAMLCVSHCGFEPLSLAVTALAYVAVAMCCTRIHTVHTHEIYCIHNNNNMLSCNSPTLAVVGVPSSERCCEYAVIGLLASYSRNRAPLKEPHRRSAVEGSL